MAHRRRWRLADPTVFTEPPCNGSDWRREPRRATRCAAVGPGRRRAQPGLDRRGRGDLHGPGCAVVCRRRRGPDGARGRVDVRRRPAGVAAPGAAPTGDGGRRRALRLPRRSVGPAPAHEPIHRDDHVRAGRTGRRVDPTDQAHPRHGHRHRAGRPCLCGERPAPAVVGAPHRGRQLPRSPTSGSASASLTTEQQDQYVAEEALVAVEDRRARSAHDRRRPTPSRCGHFAASWRAPPRPETLPATCCSRRPSHHRPARLRLDRRQQRSARCPAGRDGCCAFRHRCPSPTVSSARWSARSRRGRCAGRSPPRAGSQLGECSPLTLLRSRVRSCGVRVPRPGT